jgi:hypothetical protein
MNPVFQFIAATLIVALTLGFTLYAVASTSDVQLMTYSQLQLEPVANSLMQNFVLTPGSPVDWGSNTKVTPNQLASFGLSTDPQTNTAYSLDVFKLDRILNDSFVANPYYIPPTVAGSLLGIYQQGHFNYGFDFRMVPALNITISNISTATTTLYSVKVLDFQGRPAVNAFVNASEFSFCVVTKGNSVSPSSYNSTHTSAFNVTNLAGTATVTLSQPPVGCTSQNGNGGNGGGSTGNVESTDIMIVSASYYGMAFQNFLQSSNICKSQMIIIGQYLVANFTGKNGASSQSNCSFVNQNNGSGKVATTVFEITSRLNIVLDPANYCSTSQPPCSILNHGADNYTVFALSKPVDPNVILAGLIFTTNGKQYFVIATNPTTPTGIIEYTSNSLTTVSANTGDGLKLASVPAAVTVTRYVTVGTNTWFASLTVWRMGQ